MREKSIVQRDGQAQERAQAKLERNRRWFERKKSTFFVRSANAPVRRRTHPMKSSILRPNTPFRRPSCQAREEKRKFSPMANSLRRRRQQSRTSDTALRAHAEERISRPKVHQARRDDRFSSRFLSLLLTAAIVPTRPIPLLLCSPLPLSLSRRPGLMHSKM